ncbi:MAG TPA: hypothetical protein VD995_03190 [Azospirillum sp.]|nr:hypothetical protein [Azospirillum sp.]
MADLLPIIEAHIRRAVAQRLHRQFGGRSIPVTATLHALELEKADLDALEDALHAVWDVDLIVFRDDSAFSLAERVARRIPPGTPVPAARLGWPYVETDAADVPIDADYALDGAGRLDIDHPGLWRPGVWLHWKGEPATNAALHAEWLARHHATPSQERSAA